MAGPGLVLIIPVVQQAVRTDLRMFVEDVPPQDVISHDNVSVKVNAVIYFRIVDPQRAIINVADFRMAVSQLAQTTLRSVLGKHDLDEMLAERDKLNADIQEILDRQTDAWGIKVANVEIKHVDIDVEMVRAIAKQAEAERLRRARIINAEGEQQAAAKLVEAGRTLAETAERHAAALSERAGGFRRRAGLDDRIADPGRPAAPARRRLGKLRAGSIGTPATVHEPPRRVTTALGRSSASTRRWRRQPPTPCSPKFRADPRAGPGRIHVDEMGRNGLSGAALRPGNPEESKVLRSSPVFLPVFLAVAIAATAAAAQPVEQGPPNVPQFTPAFPEQTRAPASNSGVELDVRTIAAPLERPWGVAVLPDGGYLVTERPGRMRHITADGTISAPIGGVPQVLAQGQGGLLDVAISPDFASDRIVYFTYAKPMGDGMSATAAARGRLSQDMTRLGDVTDIFVQEPPSETAKHYGSRIAPDGDIVWITTGEHFTRANRDKAQRLDTTYGKVIRVTVDGSVPEDNPFVGQQGTIDSIWSLGHRNIQAAALRSPGDLWTIEHGPKGGDELNHPQAGANYGWPVVSYGENYDGSPVGSGEAHHAPKGFVEPRYYWDPVIAPSGMIFYDGDMFPGWQGNVLVGSLRPGALVRLEMDGDTVVGEERLLTHEGRIRDVAQDRDGALLVLVDSAAGSLLRLTPKASGTP